MSRYFVGYIASLLLIQSFCSCGQSTVIKDDIFPVVESSGTYVFSYDGNKLRLSDKDFDAFLADKRKGAPAAAVRAKARIKEREEGAFMQIPGIRENMEWQRKLPEVMAIAGIGSDKKKSARYYDATLTCGKGQSFRMVIAVAADKPAGLNVEVSEGYNDDLKTAYAFEDGYCVGFDRRRSSSESKGFLSSTYITHNWQHELYIVAGDEITRAEYFRYDNTTEPATSVYKAYSLSSGQTEKLTRQAYFYLFLANQVLQHPASNCFFHKPEVVGGKDSLKAFCNKYFRPYLSTHQTMRSPTEDGVDFSLHIDSNGTASLIPATLRPYCDVFRPAFCDSNTLKIMKADLANLLEQHLPELRILPKEEQCRHLSSRLRITFHMDDYFGVSYTEEDSEGR